MSPTDPTLRPPRSRRRLLTAGALVAVAVLGSGVAWRLSGAGEDATPASRPAPSVRAADVRRWINPGYEPGDLHSHAYRLPPVRAPWPADADAGDTLDTSTAMPPVPGLTCGSDVRQVPRPAAMVSITRADLHRLATVTGWGRGLGRRRFAQFVAGDGPCLWFAQPRPIARAHWAGDEGWLAVASPDAPAGADVSVQAFAIERLGDLIVAVEVSEAGSGAGPGSGAGSGAEGPAQQLAEQAAQWADALAQQLLASHHPALTGQMPVAGEDAPVRYVTPTPDVSPSAGNPLGDRVQPPAAELPPALLLLGARAQRPAAEHARADCVGRQVPDARTAARTWVYERGGPGVASAMVIVDVSRWPSGQGAARFSARRGWGDACDALAPPSTPVPPPSTPVPPTSAAADPAARSWADARHVLLFRPSPAWQARALVGDDVVSVEIFVQDQRLTGPEAQELARRVADAFAARLR